MILIIAYGNSLRRDDGAGLILGELLEEALRRRGQEVARIAVHQLTPDLALSVAEDGVSAVVFVDTRVAASNDEHIELQVRCLDSEGHGQSLGHHVGAASVMSCARLLYHRNPPAWLLTVPGVDFDHGEGLSEVAQEAINTLPGLLQQLPPDWPLCPA